MEFDFSWLLLGLPVAFALGWLASRFDLRQLRIENRNAPRAYFKGLNFLLNEQQDQAIDAFIEAVQNDPDTSELHFALGNLFRRRGEYDRAVRVHEHLLSRADLSQADRDRAQHALALDFLKAGLLDRAEDALRRLEGTAFENQARLALLAIYERSRDWSQAAEIARRLDGSDQASFGGRRAHYLCEQAAGHVAGGRDVQARELLEQAVATAPAAPRARIELASLLMRDGLADDAWRHLRTLVDASPISLPLFARELVEAAQASGHETEARDLLLASYAQSPSLDLVEALILSGAPLPAPGADTPTATAWYAEHLRREPSLVAASRWLSRERLESEQLHPQVQRALDHAAKPLMRYRCAACGFEAQRHFWQCPGCQAWDSYPARRVEEL
ncbi:MAG: lipopolysaccharide assembly protein LapB [Burkholderiaceae bacterium]|nr:lipopolysaccharide assembly protein LapB [Burkholderiaceae bacterium]